MLNVLVVKFAIGKNMVHIMLWTPPR